jgi:Flp pilus assembly protein TadD
MPVTNYKTQRWQEAIAGLAFESGRVRIESAAAAEIAGAGDAAEARAHYEAGMNRMQHGHREWAVGEFRTAILLAPDEPRLYEGLGYALISKGKSDMALAAYRTALDLEPARLSARVGVAKALDSGSRELEALAAWQDVLALEPDHAAAHNRLASLNYFAGNYAQALSHYERAEALGHPVPAQLRPLIEKKLANPDA